MIIATLTSSRFLSREREGESVRKGERERGGKAENESTARQIQNDHARSHHAT